MNPFAILWKSVVDVYDNLFPMVGMNLLWLLGSIPVVVVVTGVLILLQLPSTIAFSVALLFAVLAPSPASVGVHTYANHLVKEDRVEFELFWSGLRSLWSRSLALLAIGVAGAALLGVNLYFYLTNGTQILRYLAILWLYGLILWTMMLLYMNPLLVEQENKSLKLIVRNAFVLCLDNLIPSVVILVVLLALSVVSIGITLLVALLTGSFVAVVETRAVVTYLEKYRSRSTKPSA
jgi:uncharacterized membrane protein YesL